MPPSTRRKDDDLMKWLLGVCASIVVLFIGQFIFMIQSNASTVERVNANTSAINELKDFKYKLIRIEVMSEMTVNKVNEIAARSTVTRDEQISRTSDIKNIRSHVKDNKRHKGRN